MPARGQHDPPRLLGAALLPRSSLFEIPEASFRIVAESEMLGNKAFDSGVSALG